MSMNQPPAPEARDEKQTILDAVLDYGKAMRRYTYVCAYDISGGEEAYRIRDERVIALNKVRSLLGLPEIEIEEPTNA